MPTQDDLVLAVSHAWSHQLHPDPLGLLDAIQMAGLTKCPENPWLSDFPGKKAQEIKQLTAEARLVLMLGVSSRVSTDWLRWAGPEGSQGLWRAETWQI